MNFARLLKGAARSESQTPSRKQNLPSNQGGISACDWVIVDNAQQRFGDKGSQFARLSSSIGDSQPRKTFVNRSKAAG